MKWLRMAQFTAERVMAKILLGGRSGHDLAGPLEAR
jgi:hypothetical protein